MSTAPFLSDTPSLITETHRQVVRARATHPDFESAYELDIDADRGVTLTWDERRSPRVMARLTVKVPDALADINALDPRTGVRVEIDCGYVRPGGDEDVWTIADLGLRRVSVNRPDNTMDLECASDEALLVDGSPQATGSVTGTTHTGAIQTIINGVISPAPLYSITASAGGSVTVDPVTDRFDTAKDIADRLGAQVYDDGLRTWNIAPAPTVGTSELSLVVGEGGTILSADSSIERDSWHNYVFLRYRWRDTAGTEQQIHATAYVSDGPYRIDGPAGKRILIEEREVPTTQANANAAAAAILQRTQTRASTYRLTAIAAYWLRPGMTISVTLPLAAAAKHLVQSVTFNPLAGTMDLETRLPDTTTATVATTTPPASAPVADPVPAAKTTYVSSWVASSSQAYQGDGDKRTDIPTEIAQGYYSSFNGNQSSIVLFTGANSTGSETGKTISQALTGATISKVEVYLYANHWYSFAGGTARIGYADVASMPTTFAGGSPYVTVSGWKANTGRWVTITNSNLIKNLLDGSARAVTVGPGVGTNQTYYGKFNGASASSGKPVLRITYSK